MQIELFTVHASHIGTYISLQPAVYYSSVITMRVLQVFAPLTPQVLPLLPSLRPAVCLASTERRGDSCIAETMQKWTSFTGFEYYWLLWNLPCSLAVKDLQACQTGHFGSSLCA